MINNIYNIGLDIGTNSVGWAVTDKNAHLMKFKGKNMWGVRLFEKGETAASRRVYRSTRRRLERRKQRLNNLQRIFDPEISKIDPNFFRRLKESFLYTEDKSILSSSILFDDSNYSDRDFYKAYPTIYHLRIDLMNEDKKKDLRLVYLALHHILKYRGNFLYGKTDFGKISDDIEESLRFSYLNLFMDDEYDIEFSNFSEWKEILSLNIKKSNKGEKLQKLLNNKDRNINNRTKEMIKAILGYKFNLVKLFNLEDIEQSGTKSFSEEIDEAEIESILGDKIEIFNSLWSIYNWITLEDLLGSIDSKNPMDKTISNAMIAKYKTHKIELKMLKELIKESCKDEYNNIFRKEGKEANYSNYIKKTKDYSLENFNKYIKKVLDKYPLVKNHRYYNDIYERLLENRLLAKLNTTDNSVIPYQLHKIEMERILESQSKYYPFLIEHKTLLIKMLESRIPYYVGPLNKHSKFAWLERNNNETEIYPWNYEESIDIDKTAEKFITRMTNKCTYLYEENVLPRYSLIYSEFILLNELNKVRINGELIASDVKKKIINEIFKIKKTVKVNDIVEWVKRNPHGILTNPSKEIVVEGTQKENEFAASLASYYDFEKLFGEINDSNFKMIEEIINWITIFEDKEILKRKIKERYKLNEMQIERISKLNYTGWARLSKKLISGITNNKDSRNLGKTILDIMRNTNYNFMQIINDSKFDFKKTIDEINPVFKKVKLEYEDIKKLQGSPAIKRAIWETVKIVDEIIGIMGHEPNNIFIEFARDDEEAKRTTSRVKRIKNLYDVIKDDVHMHNSTVYQELKSYIDANNKLDDKSLYLYFTQNGKCMYTGQPLNPENLSQYQIDHIIPRSYIKDDSIDNSVLVMSGANQSKKDNLLIDSKIQNKQKEYWDNLYKYGLISRKKLDNLMKTTIPDKEIIGFINRQLVETRQISKHVSDLLGEIYEDTGIISIKAKLTSDFRNQYALYKNREINDYHHAHDALITSVLGNFIIQRYPRLEDEFNVKEYIKWFKRSGMAKDNKNKYGFVLSSMNKDYQSDDFQWEKDKELGRVIKSLSYKDCYITKKVEEQTGKFYKETIYGKKSPDAKIPLKKGLDPKKYGGYSGVQNAYYVIIEYLRKNKKIKKLVGIPIFVASIKEKNYLREYLIGSEQIEDANTLVILKNKIKKYQLIDYQGHEVYLISNTDLQNAVQLLIKDEYSILFYMISKDLLYSDLDKKYYYEELMTSFIDYFSEKLIRHYPFYHTLGLQLKESKADFVDLSLEDKVEFVKQLVRITSVDSRYGDFKKYNTVIKSAEAGRTRNRSKDGWDTDKITFIDKSITGLFERRYKL